MAASSSSVQDPASLVGPTPPPSSSRRLPPPCWSHDETIALIDAYRDKWYSLRRGNLRAPHWQEVADAVAARCPIDPSKTAVQCRHKMEKLRKRYRAELQRSLSIPNGHRYCSPWVHFKRMDSMEKGPITSAIPIATASVGRYEDEEVEEDQDDAEDFYQNSVKHAIPYNSQSFHGSMSNGSGGGGGVRIRIPGRSTVGPPPVKTYSKFDDTGSYNPTLNPNSTPNYGSTKVLRDGYSGRFGLGKKGGDGGDAARGKKMGGDPVAEMVSAIKVLGDGFVKMERMKMEMAREVEEMRMDMELKRTEMILDSQQRIVEAFAKASSERKSKKVKRMSSPESVA